MIFNYILMRFILRTNKVLTVRKYRMISRRKAKRKKKDKIKIAILRHGMKLRKVTLSRIIGMIFKKNARTRETNVLKKKQMFAGKHMHVMYQGRNSILTLSFDDVVEYHEPVGWFFVCPRPFLGKQATTSKLLEERQYAFRILVDRGSVVVLFSASTTLKRVIEMICPFWFFENVSVRWNQRYGATKGKQGTVIRISSSHCM